MPLQLKLLSLEPLHHQALLQLLTLLHVGPA